MPKGGHLDAHKSLLSFRKVLRSLLASEIINDPDTSKQEAHHTGSTLLLSLLFSLLVGS